MSKAQQLENAVNFALAIARDNSHGYSNVVGQNLGPNEYDCGGLISAALNHAGLLNGQVFEPNEEYGTPWSYGTVLYPIGFKKLAFNRNDCRRGDIFIKNGHHTELCTGPNTMVGAHDNYDGIPGDWGTGGEISEVQIPWGYWDYTLRLDTGSSPAPAPKPTPAGKSVSCLAFDIAQQQWLPIVTSQRYAVDTIGNPRHSMGGFAVHCADQKIRYAAHVKGAGWLPEVTGYNVKDFYNGYAGDGREIDCIIIFGKGIAYQSKCKDSQAWLPPVYSDKANYKDWRNGYAGNPGMVIDEVKIWRV